MNMFKSGYRRSFLSLVITGILLVSFAAVPLLTLVQSVAAADVLTTKWTRTGLGSGSVGVLIADVRVDIPGEEIIWVSATGVYCRRGSDGASLWSRTDLDLWYWVQPQMADLNLDGIPEIIITLSRWQNNGLIALHGNNGSTYWEIDGLGGNSMTSSPVIGDIDGDGYPTIFVASEDVIEVDARPEERDDNGLDGRARLYAISHTGVKLGETFVWRACAGGLSLADGDRDGVYELYMGDRHMYMSDGDWGKGVRSFWAENLSVRWNYPDWLCSSQAPTLADVNGDGILEVIVSNQRGGMMLLDSRTGTAIRKDSNLDLPMHYQASVGDVDGDGHLELCMADGDHTRYAVLNVTVFDLVDWTVDARIYVDNPAEENSSRCMYGPQLADVTGDGLVEMIACSYLGVHIIDPNDEYAVIDEVVWPAGPNGPWDEFDREDGEKTTYAVVQDIDGDGLVEVVVGANNGRVRAYDTPASAPTPRARTEVQFCSELRQGVAMYVPPPGQELEPIISSPSPAHKAVDVPQTLSELTFTLIDYQDDDLDYTVETSPDIGSDSGTVPSETPVSVSIESLSYSQVYSWQVNVTDGTHWTNRTFIFRTEYESVSNVPPSLDSVIIDGGDGTSGDSLTCNSESSDGDGVLEPVVNVYNWLVGGDSLTTLLLPCDIRSATTARDYSGYDNDATLHGPTWTSEGIVGGCYEFDGDDDYATIPHSASLGGSGTWSEITVELWVYLSQDQQDTRLIAKIPSYEIGFSSRGNNMLFAGVWTDTFEYDEENNEASIRGQYQGTSSYGLSINAWHHVAMTYKDGEGITLYVNGTAVAFRSHEGNIKPTTGLALGSDEPVYLGWFDFFEGKIDEVRMYRRALSPEQVYQRYMETKDGLSSSSTIVPQETARGEVWRCDVTPNDRLTDGTMRDSTIGPLANGLPMVYNPRAHAFGRTRQLALTTEDVVASYEYFDWDDDPEGSTEIQWYIDTFYNGTYDDLLEIPDTETSAGESWHFMVRPHDEYGFGEWETSLSVLIRANIPPEHTTPHIPSSGYTGDDLLCLNQSTYDANGDAVTNIYNWFNNSNSFTNLLMSFDTENLTTAKDYSGYGNDGDVLGATWTEDGVVGGAYIFDGSDYIRVEENGDSLGGDGSWSAISVEFWVKATGITSTESVVFKHDLDFSTGGWQGGAYGVGYRADFRAYDDRDRFYWYVYNDTGVENVQFSDYDNFGEWHHVVCTYASGVGLELYVDGIGRVSTAFTGNINVTLDGILDIGGYGSGGTDFSGILDEVRIYPKALSSAQVFQRYIETKDGLSSSSTIVPQETTAGETWTCQVIPNDSWQDGEAKTSNTLLVLPAGINSRPRIDLFTPSDTTPEVNEGESLNFTHISSDPDDDPLTYSWLLDGVEQADTQNWTYSPGLAGIYNVTLVVGDGEFFDSQEWSVTVVAAGEPYELTIIVVGNGTTVPAAGSHMYTAGTEVDLTANADPGWVFSEWSGDLTGFENPTTILMDENKTVTATFIMEEYTLTINIIGDGNVDMNITGPYHYGDAVELTATADPGWSFFEWTGDLTGSANPTTIVMDENKTVNSTFVEEYTLMVNVEGNGSVSLNSTGPYYYGDVVELTANADLGWSFSEWSHDLSGSENPETIVMDGDKTVNATFIQEEYTLTINVVGSGSVSLNNTGPYYYGDVVELTANPDLGWSFSDWSEDLSGSTNPETTVMDGDKIVNATFVAVECTVTFYTDPAGTGFNITFELVTYMDGEPDTFAYGTSGPASASCPEGYTFDQWIVTGDVEVLDAITANPATVNITCGGTLKAVFALIEGEVTDIVAPSGTVDVYQTFTLELTFGATLAGSAPRRAVISSNIPSGWTYLGYEATLGGVPITFSETVDSLSVSWTNETLGEGVLVLITRFQAPFSTGPYEFDGMYLYNAGEDLEIDTWILTANVVEFPSIESLVVPAEVNYSALLTVEFDVFNPGDINMDITVNVTIVFEGTLKFSLIEVKDFPSGTTSETFNWDTLDLPSEYKDGGNITVIVRLTAPGGELLDEESADSDILEATRDALWERVVDVILEWPTASAEEREELWDDLVKIILLWPIIS